MISLYCNAILQHSRERIYGPQNKKIYDEEGNDKKTGKLYIYTYVFIKITLSLIHAFIVKKWQGL